MEAADIILYVQAANPRGETPNEVTELHILRVLKTHPLLGDRKVIEVPHFIPVTDPKNPPCFVVFAEPFAGKLDVYYAMEIASDQHFAYLEGILALRGKDEVQALQFYYRFLEHADKDAAKDAFWEFKRAEIADLEKVARTLPVEDVRRKVNDPKVSPRLLDLYGRLLGFCGTDKDADLLRTRLDQRSKDREMDVEGLMLGYLNLRPAVGWEYACAILANPKEEISDRLQAHSAIRKQHSRKPAETKADFLRCLERVLHDPDFPHLAIDELRYRQYWDFTEQVLALFGKREFLEQVSLRRSILCYALACPRPEARAFVEAHRRGNADWVDEAEVWLRMEEEARKEPAKKK